MAEGSSTNTLRFNVTENMALATILEFILKNQDFISH